MGKVKVSLRVIFLHPFKTKIFYAANLLGIPMVYVVSVILNYSHVGGRFALDIAQNSFLYSSTRK